MSMNRCEPFCFGRLHNFLTRSDKHKELTSAYLKASKNARPTRGGPGTKTVRLID